MAHFVHWMWVCGRLYPIICVRLPTIGRPGGPGNADIGLNPSATMQRHISMFHPFRLGRLKIMAASAGALGGRGYPTAAAEEECPHILPVIFLLDIHVRRKYSTITPTKTVVSHTEMLVCPASCQSMETIWVIDTLGRGF